MSLSLGFFLRLLFFPGLTFILLLSMLCDWIERKIKARMQNRMGPAHTGPAGILQPIADFIKLLAKEDIVPYGAKALLFRIFPLIAFSIFALALLLIPIDGEKVISGLRFEGDLLLILALMLIANFFLFISGWSSSNPFSMIGAARVLMQLVGYDTPLFLLALNPALLAGSLNIEKIVNSQILPFILISPWSFLLFLITLQAEIEKDPFDIPCAETEIVAGYETEYSGMRLAFIMAAKDLQTLLGATLIVELFLGGANGPIIAGPQYVWRILWFTLKVIITVLLMEYLTCVFARFRIDQVVRLNWRLLVPSSLISLILAAIIKLLFLGVAASW
ncbi:MAG: complex I subunit 1 family protein [Candidatus Bathyarchaeia archaeon]